MSPPITATAVPAASRLHATIASASFHDSYYLALPGDDRSALELYLATAARTPRWVERLMALRNGIVSRLGRKDLGQLGGFDRARPAASYRAGDRVGIFSLLHVSDDEAILGDSDRHLDVRVSVCRTGGGVAVSTVVHVHRPFGHLYMFFVAPMHRRIVPATMRQLARR